MCIYISIIYIIHTIQVECYSMGRTGAFWGHDPSVGALLGMGTDHGRGQIRAGMRIQTHTHTHTHTHIHITIYACMFVYIYV